MPKVPGVEFAYGRLATSARSGSSVVTPEAETRCDRVVFATGTRSLPVHFPGSSKKGVFVLDSLPQYMELSRQLDDSVGVVVCGKGLSALQVTDRVCTGGRQVTLLCPGARLDSGLSAVVDEILQKKAATAGVRVLDASLDRAVGTDSLEAVLAGGRVIQCDTLAVVPRHIPEFPGGDLETGPRGGILVDRSLRAKSGRCYAAGGCAELNNGDGSTTQLLGRSAEASGRVAGANAAGLNLTLTPASAYDTTLFGLGLASAGLEAGEAFALGMDTVETARRRDSTSACSIVHDRPTGRVVGVQVVGASSGHLSGFLSLVVTQAVRLSNLAFADAGCSTDISLITETASQGLTWRERATGQGPNLRPSGGRETSPRQGVRSGLQTINQP